MLALLFLASCLANVYHYDGKVLNYRTKFDSSVTKSEISINIDVEPYVNITCEHKRTLEHYPCYKWIELDVNSEKCLKAIGDKIQEVKIWFDHETFKVWLKHYVGYTVEAKAIEHSDKDICTR